MHINLLALVCLLFNLYLTPQYRVDREHHQLHLWNTAPAIDYCRWCPWRAAPLRQFLFILHWIQVCVRKSVLRASSMHRGIHPGNDYMDAHAQDSRMDCQLSEEPSLLNINLVHTISRVDAVLCLPAGSSGDLKLQFVTAQPEAGVCPSAGICTVSAIIR